MTLDNTWSNGFGSGDRVVISLDARTVYCSTLSVAPDTFPHTPQVCPAVTTSAILCDARAAIHQPGWARPVWENWMQQLKIEL